MLPRIHLILIFLSCVSGYFGLDCSKRLYNVVGEKEIRVFNEKASYSEAEEICTHWGHMRDTRGTGRLASIKTIEDQKCIQQMISNPNNYQKKEWDERNPFDSGYFVGGSDASQEGNWIWSDGSDMESYTNWAFHEPDNRFNQDCLLVLLGNTSYEDYKTGKWMDVNCSDKKFFICERDISSPLLWSYQEDGHGLPPSRWSEKYPSCKEGVQSPIDISASMLNRAMLCNDSIRYIKGWGVTPGSKWTVENTGRFIKVKIEDRSMWTAFYGINPVTRRPEIKYVDYFIIKWGEENTLGSEHSIDGRKTHGELQVYHKPSSNGEVHAYAFFLSMRSFQPNKNWIPLLSNITLVQASGAKVTMPAPSRGIGQLLGDSFRPGISRKAILRHYPLRYRGSLPFPPCTKDVIWTVHPKAVHLSFSQFRDLRLIYQEDGRTRLSNNFRPLQKEQIEICSLSSKISSSHIH